MLLSKGRAITSAHSGLFQQRLRNPNMKNFQLLLGLLLPLFISNCSVDPAINRSSLDTLYSYQWVQPKNRNAGTSTTDIAQTLRDYDVIFFGELHTHPAVHQAQMALFQALARLGKPLTLSLEQFERDTQELMDDYLAGRIGEQYLVDKGRAWNNYETSYRPLVEYAKSQNFPVIAANAPKSIVVCVGRKGLQALDNLSVQERKYVAKEIDISASAYQQKFINFMQTDSVHGYSSSEQSGAIQRLQLRGYAAQATRDDTMAESIAEHLKRQPRQVFHLNGNFHSSGFQGTVERLLKRMPDLKVAVIHTLPLLGNLTELVQQEKEKGSVLLLVSPLPKKFIKEENRQQWMRKQMEKRMEDRGNCQ